jgi:hypothetical protein
MLDYKYRSNIILIFGGYFMKMKLLGIFLLLGFIPFSTVCAHASPVKYYHYRIQAENKTHQQTTPYLEMSQKTNLMSLGIFP